MIPLFLVLLVDLVILRAAAAQAARRSASPTSPSRAPPTTPITRAMQMKFMRLPKPKVKIGEELPEHYR